jgi:hypothetical protein
MPFPPIIPRRRVKLPSAAEWAAFEDVLRGLPDWIAWRLEAWVVMANDRGLSPPVLDAWWWRS